MCRADIAPEIHERLGALLADMGRALATLAGQPDAVNPAIAFSLFWVLGLPILVHASCHQSGEDS